jgi:LysM domain
MPLLNDSEITVAALMADLPMQRSARNQLEIQLLTLQEGLELGFNPLERTSPIRYHRVGDFETLPIISNRLFGSPNHWEAIAQVNGIDYPYVVVPGQVLRVPDVRRHG